jgi:hypothetical protein
MAASGRSRRRRRDSAGHRPSVECRAERFPAQSGHAVCDPGSPHKDPICQSRWHLVTASMDCSGAVFALRDPDSTNADEGGRAAFCDGAVHRHSCSHLLRELVRDPPGEVPDRFDVAASWLGRPKGDRRRPDLGELALAHWRRVSVTSAEPSRSPSGSADLAHRAIATALAHSLLTTERHRIAQDDTRRHRTTRRAGICAWLQQP